jgi:hypothetical protein
MWSEIKEGDDEGDKLEDDDDDDDEKEEEDGDNEI